MINDKNFESFENGEDFDQEEFKRISELALAETRRFVNEQIEKNTDKREKTIGDQVYVWDGSRLTDVETGEIEYDPKVQEIIAKNPSIVIEYDNKYQAKLTTFAGDFTKTLDLVVWNKNLNKKYRTSSEFVKLI